MTWEIDFLYFACKCMGSRGDRSANSSNGASSDAFEPSQASISRGQNEHQPDATACVDPSSADCPAPGYETSPLAQTEVCADQRKSNRISVQPDESAKAPAPFANSSAPSPSKSVLQDRQPPEDIVRLCKALYMHPDAAAGWAMMHESPCQCLVAFFVCYVIVILGIDGTFTWGLLWSPWFPYIALPCACLMFPADLVAICNFWRYGPSFAKSTTFAIGGIFNVLPLVVLLALTYLLPGKMNVLGDQVVCTAVLFLVSIAAEMTMKLASEFPEQPIKGFSAPLFDSFLRVVQALDALTDMGVVRLLAKKVRGQGLLKGANESTQAIPVELALQFSHLEASSSA
jgi:hypothetical protein